VSRYLIVFVWYAFASMIAFVAYGVDKRAAVRGTWRIGERQLHLWSVLGGFPGAWFGQRVFRHKRGKRSFMVLYWMCVFAHAIGWSVWLWIAFGLPWSN